MKKLLLHLLLLAGLSASAQKKALFIGNSYTYVNDLPALVSALASAGGDSLYTASSAIGGYTLQLHSTTAATTSLIASDSWDYVILQEQSQIPSFSPPEVDSLMFPYAIYLDSLIHANRPCTQTIFFMTWGRKYGDASNCAVYPPVCTFEGMQERLRDSYLHISDSVHAMAAPVGMSFFNCRAADSTLELYSSDYSHPSLAGSYLAACTFYATIYRRSPVGNTYTAGLDTVTAQFLQNIASHTVLDSLINWHIGQFEPHAAFTFSVTGNDVSFYSDSSAGLQHHWSFGDTTASPVHTFPLGGTFPVRHILCDACRCDTVTDTVFIAFTGILPADIPVSFTLYPNPAHEHACLTADRNTEAVLCDSQGKILRRLTLKKEKVTVIDRQGLPAGTYFIRGLNGTPNMRVVFIDR